MKMPHNAYCMLCSDAWPVSLSSLVGMLPWMIQGFMFMKATRAVVASLSCRSFRSFGQCLFFAMQVITLRAGGPNRQTAANTGAKPLQILLVWGTVCFEMECKDNFSTNLGVLQHRLDQIGISDDLGPFVVIHLKACPKAAMQQQLRKLAQVYYPSAHQQWYTGPRQDSGDC